MISLTQTKRNCTSGIQITVTRMCIIFQSDRKKYGRLIEELENDHTKGNGNYHEDMVKAYQFLNQHKHYNPRTTNPPAYGVEFSQKCTKENNYRKNVDKKSANCPNTKREKYDNKESTDKDKNKAHEKYSQIK